MFLPEKAAVFPAFTAAVCAFFIMTAAFYWGALRLVDMGLLNQRLRRKNFARPQVTPGRGEQRVAALCKDSGCLSFPVGGRRKLLGSWGRGGDFLGL